MATIVVMPQLGNSVESCLIMSWEVAVGDTVAVDQVLCSVETDKSTMEVQSTDAGTVLKLLWEEGDEVPVKDPLIILGEPGEDISSLVPGGSTDAAPAASNDEAPAEAAPAAEAPAPSFATSASGGAISPRARSLAEGHGLDASAVTEGSGPGGRVIERDVQAHLAANPATSAARAEGASGSGTGLGGRVSTADLAAGAAAAPAPAAASAAAPVSAGEYPGATESAPLKGIRKVVAERMVASLAEAAQLSYTVSAKADGLLAMRKKLKNADESLGLNAITIGDLVGYAVVKTLTKYPVFNATLADGVLTTFENVHLGFAADTPRGLLVPVVRGASAMTLKQFSAASKQLAADAIAGTISPDLLSGGTFTVSNLGSFGVETFTPIINRPQTAILGVAAITPRAVVLADGSVGVEQRIGFSLTADHQVIDGADAARFLRDLVAAIENIDVTVLG
ncbi:dihydrolipoamide acetyltransferase family protein [Schaalia canis]|uniref:Dihydrolipoamide acetyltransferase component of pyruvate dehydrogenase complex n=1 Tax=Schaalia canis TaxID=100469 RepID=A0A3P1SGA4_9ACTO|nr:dihydrolipoamide acetyltransferase family protein [Schaalia canis]RRC95775.1 2-oxo acid dehydrogenase subunit E2 [Schaalia canis]